MAKRERLEIIHAILQIIHDHHNSIKPTPLLRASNVSSQRFNEYYDELIEKGFIREETDKSGKYVTLTDRGFAFLSKYQLIVSFIDEFEL